MVIRCVFVGLKGGCDVGVKASIEFELSPKQVEPGTNWINVDLNVGSESLFGLDIRLASRDTYSIRVMEAGVYPKDLKPNKVERVRFHVMSRMSGTVYVVIHSLRGGSQFFWVSPDIPVKMGKVMVELKSLFIVSLLIRCLASC